MYPTVTYETFALVNELLSSLKSGFEVLWQQLQETLLGDQYVVILPESEIVWT